MKIKIIIKAISVLACIIPICVFTYFEFVGQASFYTYSSNKILIVILELINVGIVLLAFKNKNVLSKKYIIVLMIYLIIIGLILYYNVSRTYAPTGPKSELMGLALERNYMDIFGINLRWIK